MICRPTVRCLPYFYINNIKKLDLVVIIRNKIFYILLVRFGATLDLINTTGLQFMLGKSV